MSLGRWNKNNRRGHPCPMDTFSSCCLLLILSANSRECQSWSGSKPFDTLVVFLKEYFVKAILKQESSLKDILEIPYHRMTFS